MKKALLIITILFVFKGQGQTVPQFTQTPSTASMMGNSLVQMDDFRGKANINIPLFTMSLGDQEVPFSLYYNTGGVKVEDVGGNIGMNWNFTGESKIVRKQNGLPDDLKSYVFAKYNIPQSLAAIWTMMGADIQSLYCLNLYEADNVGYMYSANTINSDVNNYNKNFGRISVDKLYFPQVGFTNFPSAFTNNSKYIEGSLDTGPDEFVAFLPDGSSFNFMYDTASGKMKSLNSENYKIHHDYSESNGIYSFVLTDKQGISYLFAEPESMHMRELTGELETSVLPYTTFDSAENKPMHNLNICGGTANHLIDKYKNKKVRHAWHLVRISSYNAGVEDNINFEYDDVNVLNIGYPRTYLKFNKGNKSVVTNKNYVYKNWINTKQLKRIYNNTTQVDFLYSDFRQDLISAGNYSTSRVLAGIGVYDKTRLIYPEVQINFNNSYVLSNETQISNVDLAVYKRLFLNSIEFYKDASPSGLYNKYTFTYIKPDELPNKQSLQTDLFGYFIPNWGRRFPSLYYYSGMNQFSFTEGKFSPYYKTPTSYPYISISSMVNDSSQDFESKLPSNNNMNNRGALESIKDFYGKITRLTYENNNFTTYFGTTEKSGGLRIKQIEEIDSKTNISYKKNYTYNDNGQGRLENIPILAYETREEDREYIHLSNKPFNYLADFTTYYPKVKIIEGNGEYGHQINNYSYYNISNINSVVSNYIDISNRFYTLYNSYNDNDNYYPLMPPDVEHHFEFSNTTQNPFIKKTDLGNINGYKISEQVFNSSNKIVKEKLWSYNITNTRFKRLDTGAYHGGYEVQYFFRINPTEIIEKDYTEKNGANVFLENKTNFTFDEYQNIKTEKKYDSKGNELITEFTYPYNYPTSDAIMNGLIQNRSISNFITKKSSFNNEELYLEKNKFKLFNQTSKLIERSLKKNGLEEHVMEKIDQYENEKIVQYTDKSGNKVSVVWGYNNSLPVAEVLGIEYNVIKPLIAQIDFNNLTLDSFDFLRNQFPHTLITNYTYSSATSKLLTGKKQPNEEKVFYRYNSKGNLYRVIDEYNNTLEQYEYNFVN